MGGPHKKNILIKQYQFYSEKVKPIIIVTGGIFQVAFNILQKSCLKSSNVNSTTKAQLGGDFERER